MTGSDASGSADAAAATGSALNMAASGVRGKRGKLVDEPTRMLIARLRASGAKINQICAGTLLARRTVFKHLSQGRPPKTQGRPPKARKRKEREERVPREERKQRKQQEEREEREIMPPHILARLEPQRPLPGHGVTLCCLQMSCVCGRLGRLGPDDVRKEVSEEWMRALAEEREAMFRN
jgi:hypothetical protein